jgi:protein-L-isoaspartate(D-aspartate) O-methyltransferase
MASMIELRNRMVARQVSARGVRDTLVLKAMQTVAREKFVPRRLRTRAYADVPLPIGAGQTISQPYIVAFMVEALQLEGGETMLEIGAGSGYAAAILAEIARDVYAVERIAQLAEKAATTLTDAGYANVHLRHGDGTLGWPDFAPFDAILVSAGAESVPSALPAQLKIAGRLVIPVGPTRFAQELIRITRRSATSFVSENLADVCFVPLIGGSSETSTLTPV